MSKERQQRRQEIVRRKILDTAKEIMAKEGVQGLSIRKITNAIDYSPAIIYHYFKDKNEIIETIMGEGYGRILASIRMVKRNENQPEKEIKEVLTNYIKASLASPEEYKTFLLNDDPVILKKTGLLEKGISAKSPSIGMLCETLKRGITQGRFKTFDLELTAQIFWTSTFGLIVKIIYEKNIPEEQVNRLIDQHFNLLFNGLMISNHE